MKAIKLYEQWLEEEAVKAADTTSTTTLAQETSAPNTYDIEVIPTGKATFQFTATGDQAEDTNAVRSFVMVDPKTSTGTKDNKVMISKQKDKEGEYDIVITDPNNVEKSEVYSGQVKITKA